jgi:hypothetical protein
MLHEDAGCDRQNASWARGSCKATERNLHRPEAGANRIAREIGRACSFKSGAVLSLYTHTPSPRSLSNFSSLKFRLSMACLLLLLSLCWCWRFTLATAVCRLAIVRFPFVLLCRNVNGEYLFSALLGQTASCWNLDSFLQSWFVWWW